MFTKQNFAHEAHNLLLFFHIAFLDGLKALLVKSIEKGFHVLLLIAGWRMACCNVRERVGAQSVGCTQPATRYPEFVQAG